MSKNISMTMAGKAHMIEVCSLTNVPPSNSNRGENGEIKSGYLSDIERSRFSTQSIGFAMRSSEYFEELEKYLDNKIGSALRTARLGKFIIDELEADGEELSLSMQKAIISLCKTLNSADKATSVTYDKEKDIYDFSKIKKSSKTKKNIDEVENVENAESDSDELENEDDILTKKNEQLVTLVYSKEQARIIKDNIKKLYYDSGKDIDKFKVATNVLVFKRSKGYDKFEDVPYQSLETIIFGGMSTGKYVKSIPAALKRAQPISTNPLTRESDFFIAADDYVLQNSEKDSGAGSMGAIAFASPCMYKYASLDIDILRSNLKNVELGDELFQAIVKFIISGFATTLPKGHETTFATCVNPAAICITIKERKIPCNYTNAFEVPIRGTYTKSVSEGSIEALVKEINIMDKTYGVDIIERGWLNIRSEVKPDICNVYDDEDALFNIIVKYL